MAAADQHSLPGMPQKQPAGLPYGDWPLGHDQHPANPIDVLGGRPPATAGDLIPAADDDSLYVGGGDDCAQSYQWCVWCGKEFAWEGTIPVLCADCWSNRVKRVQP